MGAAKESPATQVLEWAVGKVSEASQTDWLEKLTALTASKPAYLKNVNFGPSVPSHASAPAPSSSPSQSPSPSPAGGPTQAELDAALSRARAAEAKAESLAQRVAKLEQQLAATNSHDEVTVPDEEDHKHWWSRHH